MIDLGHWQRCDIYVHDQVQRGNLDVDQRILDAGCGSGRNSVGLVAAGAEVHFVDRAENAIAHLRTGLTASGLDVPAERIRTAELTQLPFDDGFFDAILCIAVLHFADDEKHFHAMLDEMWRVLRPGGLLFARLTSTVGLDGQLEHVDGRWYRQPDGDERFLVDSAYLAETEQRLGAKRAEVFKTVVVEDRRSMSNWCLRKPTQSWNQRKPT